jgi:hypothetical protein
MKLLGLLMCLAAPELTTQVQQLLSDESAIGGDFVQTKTIQGFKKPLVSNGSFVVRKGHSVTWSTLTPFKSELVVQADRIFSSARGAELFRVEAEKDPGVRLVTSVLFAVLRGDLESLSTHFVIQGNSERGRWTVVLEPKRGPMERVFQRIRLSGAKYVEAIEFRERGGDETRVLLTNARAIE